MTEFANHLEGFTQRMVSNFPLAKDFVEMEKAQMLERFPELSPSTESTEPTPEKRQYDVINFALNSSVNNSRRMCYHTMEIKRETPEDCVETLNLLANAIGNAHRDILFYSATQGDILSSLKDVYGSSFQAVIRILKLYSQSVKRREMFGVICIRIGRCNFKSIHM